MNKVIKNGLVGVVLSKSYKSGWFTLHGVEALLYDPFMIRFIEENNNFKESLEAAYDAEAYCDVAYGYKDCYGDVTELKVEWILEDRSFIVREIYGWETIIITDGE